MAIKPILFNTDMVQAILDGRKTVTRRVCKITVNDGEKVDHAACATATFPCRNRYGPCANFYGPAGYYAGAAKQMLFPGDVLYVRETWCWCPCWDCGMLPEDETTCQEDNVERVYSKAKYEWGCYCYKASCRENEQPSVDVWHPSIHMPREAARIFLRVKAVRVERLQDSFSEPISPIFELLAEGMDIGDDCRECIDAYGNPCCVDTVDEDGSDMYGGECGLLDDIRGDFSDLWDSTIKPADRDLYGWAANPWVWAIEFERISKEDVTKNDQSIL